MIGIVSGRLVNFCIAPLTFRAIPIDLTIMALFLGETTDIQIFRVATLTNDTRLPASARYSAATVHRHSIDNDSRGGSDAAALYFQ